MCFNLWLRQMPDFTLMKTLHHHNISDVWFETDSLYRVIPSCQLYSMLYLSGALVLFLFSFYSERGPAWLLRPTQSPPPPPPLLFLSELSCWVSEKLCGSVEEENISKLKRLKASTQLISWLRGGNREQCVKSVDMNVSRAPDEADVTPSCVSPRMERGDKPTACWDPRVLMHRGPL